MSYLSRKDIIMKKRELTKETKAKILKCAAGILRMHGAVAGDRTCQDWSSNEEPSPKELFNEKELDDLAFNYELHNSGGDDYDEDYNGMHDEMMASFCIAAMIEDMAI